MIKFENVSKSYSKDNLAVVNNLNLHIKKGEICMLVGPSGCGKTTTIKMINKLIQPNYGKIFIDGKDSETLDSIQLRLNIGYIIQDIGLFPHMTIAENIATVPIELGWRKDQIKTRVDELLELMDLAPNIYRNKRPRELSGGQKQRIGIARALAADPPIMLMDEPFGALDPITRAKLQDEFLKIQEKIKKTIVFVTHDMNEAIKMGDKIAVLKEGKIVQVGTPNDILSHPADQFVTELIGGHSALKVMELIPCKQILLPLDDVHTKEKFKTNDIKTNTIHTIPLEATAQDVLSKMLSTGQTYIFVVELGEIKGMVTMDHLLKVVSNYANQGR